MVEFAGHIWISLGYVVQTQPGTDEFLVSFRILELDDQLRVVQTLSPIDQGNRQLESHAIGKLRDPLREQDHLMIEIAGFKTEDDLEDCHGCYSIHDYFEIKHGTLHQVASLPIYDSNMVIEDSRSSWQVLDDGTIARFGNNMYVTAYAGYRCNPAQVAHEPRNP